MTFTGLYILGAPMQESKSTRLNLANILALKHKWKTESKSKDSKFSQLETAVDASLYMLSKTVCLSTREIHKVIE